MDIRDFKETIPAPSPNTIHEIFRMQRELLDQYVKIEKLIPYPVNIDSPTDQVLIKDFIARVTEELGEGYESYLKLLALSLDKNTDVSQYLPYLYNFNEELADAIHFLVETMIVCGISPGDIDEFIITSAFLKGYGLIKGNTYASIIDYLYTLVNIPSLDPYEFPRIILPEGDDNLLVKGGRRVSQDMVYHIGLGMWEVTYHLQLARNSLKNKPWKQSQMLSDHKVFRSEIILAFIYLVGLCRESGITEDSFFNIYRSKNQVNVFRIKSKY